MALVLSSNLLFHCFARNFIQDNGVCNVYETEIVANFHKARVRGMVINFFRLLDHNFGKYRRLLQRCFSRNRPFQHYRYSKCHISGNKLNVDGIEVSSFCSECALFELCNKTRICFNRQLTHFGMCGHKCNVSHGGIALKTFKFYQS